MVANWVRNVDTSDCVNPDWRRRSKPLRRGRTDGAGAVDADWLLLVSGGSAAARDSASRSSEGRGSSEIEQLRYIREKGRSTDLPLPLGSWSLSDVDGGGGGGGALTTEERAEESGSRRPWWMSRRRFLVARRVRRRCFRERTVVVCGEGMSRSTSGKELENRMVRWRGRLVVPDDGDGVMMIEFYSSTFCDRKLEPVSFAGGEQIQGCRDACC